MTSTWRESKCWRPCATGSKGRSDKRRRFASDCAPPRGCIASHLGAGIPSRRGPCSPELPGVCIKCPEGALLRRQLTEKEQELLAERTESARSRRILELVPILLYVFDLVEQCNVYANHEIAELLGYSPEQIQAMGTQVLGMCIHPDDLRRVPEYHARLSEAADGELIFAVDTEGWCILANRQVDAFFGVQKGELLRKTNDDLLPEEAARAVNAVMRAALHARRRPARHRDAGALQSGIAYALKNSHS